MYSKLPLSPHTDCHFFCSKYSSGVLSQGEWHSKMFWYTKWHWKVSGTGSGPQAFLVPQWHSKFSACGGHWLLKMDPSQYNSGVLIGWSKVAVRGEGVCCIIYTANSSHKDCHFWPQKQNAIGIWLRPFFKSQCPPQAKKCFWALDKFLNLSIIFEYLWNICTCTLRRLATTATNSASTANVIENSQKLERVQK